MDPSQNGLLAAMSSDDLALLEPKLEPLTLKGVLVMRRIHYEVRFAR